MESEYVSVQSEFSGTSMDFPVTNDCVNLGTLKSAFPYAHGLVYQEENRTRVVEFDADTKKFILPVGWKSKMFRVICKNGPASTTEETFTTSTAEDVPDESYSKFAFYTKVFMKNDDGKIIENEAIKNSCAPFSTYQHGSRYFIVSTRHGSHKCLKKGDKVFVYNVDHKKFEVEVIVVDKEMDFIVFESSTRLCEKMPVVSSLYAGLSYALIGYDERSQELNGNEHIFPTFLRGRIMSGQPHKRGHVCGSSDGVPGFSGGGVFATGLKLIGVCNSTEDSKDHPTSSTKYSSDSGGKETTSVWICSTVVIASRIDDTRSRNDKKRNSSTFWRPFSTRKVSKKTPKS